MNDPIFEKKVAPVSIYNLLIASTRPAPLDWLNPTPGMCAVAKSAESIRTTLWFTNPEQLRDLMAAGQITACRKILLQILRLHDFDPAKIPGELLPLYDAASALFQQLRKDPYAFSPPPIQDDRRPVPS
jgi:hypothetical protein